MLLLLVVLLMGGLFGETPPGLTLVVVVPELVEEEIRELLTSYKFPGSKTPIIKGSALAAVEGKDEAIGKNSILELMKAIVFFETFQNREWNCGSVH